MVTPWGSRGAGRWEEIFFFVVHFATEPNHQFCKTTNDTVGGIVERAGELAGLPSPAVACNRLLLANRGTDT